MAEHETLTTLAAGGDAAAIIEAARLGVEPTELEVGHVYGVVQADGTVAVIDLATDEHRRRQGDDPVAKTGHVHLTEHGSFSHYLNGHASRHATTLWGDRDAGRVIAVLDDHDNHDGEDRPGWGRHRATLTLSQTPAWKAWTQASGRLAGQADFAEFLEDRAGDVVDPEPARLLEVSTSIEATKGVAHKSAVRLDSGEVKVRYEETIDARAGQAGELTIPTRIELALSPYEGMEPYRVTARFRYRLGNGQLQLGIVLDRPEDVLRAAFGDVVAAVELATGLVVLHGTPRG